MDVLFALLVALTLAVGLLIVRGARTDRRCGWWSSIMLVIVVGFLTWAASGAVHPRAGAPGRRARAQRCRSSTAPSAGVIGERAGVVNIAIEGQLLAGAFCAAVVGTITGQPICSASLAAAIAGVLVAAILAFFAIRYLVDQVIVGVVLNVLVARADELPVLDQVLPRRHRRR